MRCARSTTQTCAAAITLALATFGCGSGDPFDPNRPSEFTSAGVPGGAANGRDSYGSGAPTDESGEGGGQRQVEEADIVKSDGQGRLFVVNAYRGLQILDTSNPDQPRLIGRAPILGHPVEMYLSGSLAFVIVSDYYSWWWNAETGLDNFHGSEIKAIDISDPTAPRILSSFQLEGHVTDSRRVGDVIYAVSNVYSYITTPGVPGGNYESSTYV